MASQLSLDIWSDIACPWCYIGKRRLEAALARFPHADALVIHWRAFELDPSAPPVREPEPYAARLARKYGTSVAQAQSQVDRMVGVAAADGLPFDFERIRPGNTFDAHRLLHLAGTRGLQDALKERFLRAYLCEGEAIGDKDTLRRLATSVGLDVDEVQGLLSTDLYAAEVRADQAEARALGIGGVPFFLFGRTHAVSGAQPTEIFLRALTEAWGALPDTTPVEEGAVCGPDGCA